VLKAHPDYVAKSLILRGTPGADFTWADGLLAAFACDVKDKAFTECTRLTST